VGVKMKDTDRSAHTDGFFDSVRGSFPAIAVNTLHEDGFRR
jgi:hypothetical protein